MSIIHPLMGEVEWKIFQVWDAMETSIDGDKIFSNTGNHPSILPFYIILSIPCILTSVGISAMSFGKG